MSTFGVGLVAYNMKPADVEALSASFNSETPVYKVVIDNSCLSTSEEIFTTLGWTYIHNPRNPGFGSSHNVIFKLFSHKADYHLIVNPDVTFGGAMISRLVHFLDENKNAGCVMPKVLYPDGTNQNLVKLLPSPLELILRRVPFAVVKNYINNRFVISHNDQSLETIMAPFLSGCFLMFRTTVINKIGFFDERFFMYMEDIDLCRRLWLNKTPPYYLSKAHVIHGYEKGSAKSVKLFYYHIASAVKYFNKWGWIDKERKLINKFAKNCTTSA
jgi:GT2 family glycosyltransferase